MELRNEKEAAAMKRSITAIALIAVLTLSSCGADAAATETAAAKAPALPEISAEQVEKDIPLLNEALENILKDEASKYAGDELWYSEPMTGYSLTETDGVLTAHVSNGENRYYYVIDKTLDQVILQLSAEEDGSAQFGLAVDGNDIKEYTEIYKSGKTFAEGASPIGSQFIVSGGEVVLNVGVNVDLSGVPDLELEEKPLTAAYKAL